MDQALELDQAINQVGLVDANKTAPTWTTGPLVHLLHKSNGTLVSTPIAMWSMSWTQPSTITQNQADANVGKRSEQTWRLCGEMWYQACLQATQFITYPFLLKATLFWLTKTASGTMTCTRWRTPPATMLPARTGATAGATVLGFPSTIQVATVTSRDLVVWMT